MTVVLTHGALQLMLFGKLKLAVAVVLALGLVGFAILVRPGEAKEAPKGARSRRPPVARFVPFHAEANRSLTAVRPWSGAELDKQTTFKQVLGQISKCWDGVAFTIDERAFTADGLAQVDQTKVAETDGIEGGKMKLAAALKRTLLRVPAKSGATFLIRTDGIEITTNAAVRKELDLPNERPIPPLFTQTLFKCPLAEALDVVAVLTGANVLLDVRVADKAKDVCVTASLANVPVDTAVRLLADMAGLGVVRQANVLYVTTPENATRLLAEKERDRPAPKGP